jgi:predicted sulfurtransferase
VPGSGLILLFYNFIDIDPFKLQNIIVAFCERRNLTGYIKFQCRKVRLAKEGYNITLAGSTNDVTLFMQIFIKDYIPDINNLSNIDKFIKLFFKPADGCYHCFDSLSVKIVTELCPFDGVARTNRPICSRQIINRILSEGK